MASSAVDASSNQETTHGSPMSAQGTQKRAREAGEPSESGGAGNQPLTLALLEQALQVNQQQITSCLQQSLEGLGARVGNVEKALDEHVTRSTDLFDAMTARHCAMEMSVKRVNSSYDEIKKRLDLLEGKFATAAFSGTSTKTTEGGGPETSARPAIVMGGWDADQSANETLRLVKKHVEDLAIDLDMDEAFVPGLRRGFAIVPVAPRSGEPDTDFRRRIRESLKAIRAAKLVTGQRDQGGERYFWAAMSESPERRRRAQFAGKAKRGDGGGQGHPRRRNRQPWYNGMRFASAVSTAPLGATTAGAGWIHLPSLARQLGVTEHSLTEKWDEIRKPLN